MFKCNVCSYETDRKYNLQQHNSRKNKCKPLITEPIQQKNGLLTGFSKQNEGFDHTSKQNRGFDNKCSKCNKCFNLKQVLTRHFKNCSGLNPCECQTCFKIFKTSIAKCQHNRKIKCKPPVDAPETLQEENERLKKEKFQMAEESKQKDEEIQNLKSIRPSKQY